MAKKGLDYLPPRKTQQIPADVIALGEAGKPIAEAIRTNHAKMKADVERQSGGKKTI